MLYGTVRKIDKKSGTVSGDYRFLPYDSKSDRHDTFYFQFPIGSYKHIKKKDVQFQCYIQPTSTGVVTLSDGKRSYTVNLLQVEKV